MKVVSIVGARPQFVKLAPIAKAFESSDIQHYVLNTDQHYDVAMSKNFFDDLAIPEPTWSLGIGSGSHASQTGRMLMAIESILMEEQPDWVLVYGDTNSTLAGSLAAIKLHLRVAHLEAGLRSFNRMMPEEHNRVLVDHSSDLLLAPTESALVNLTKEGLRDRGVVVGDVMIDICQMIYEQILESKAAENNYLTKQDGYYMATIHRAENTDQKERLTRIIDELEGMDLPVLLPMHPRLAKQLQSFNINIGRGAIEVIKPLRYKEMIRMMSRSSGVITDSGGLQKEAYVLQVPCTTLRNETEWTETLNNGWNALVCELSDLKTIVNRPRPTQKPIPYFGNGDAARRVVHTLETRI